MTIIHIKFEECFYKGRMEYTGVSSGRNIV